MVKSTASLTLHVRPVSGFEGTYPAGYVDRAHKHELCQLSFSFSGMVSVTVGDASYVLPPGRAIWIPSNVEHQFNCRSEIHFQTVYVQPQAANLPRQCRVFEVSPLIRGLIDEVTKFNMECGENIREGTISELLISEIERAPDLSIRACMPDDYRLRRVCSAILRSPADRRELDDWAELAGMGRRTFTRVFRQETGMSFGTWRQQVRLMEAASRLSTGEQISTIAHEVGYDSPSAFGTLFLRTFGVPPSEYRKTS